MLPCSSSFSNPQARWLRWLRLWWPTTFRDRWGASSQYIQRKKGLFICNLKITYFRGKRKWACKNRMLHCTTHFSANPGEKWAEVENSFGIERVHFLTGVLVAQMVRNLPAMQGTRVWSPGQGDPLEKEMATDFQYSRLENSMDRGA